MLKITAIILLSLALAFAVPIQKQNGKVWDFETLVDPLPTFTISPTFTFPPFILSKRENAKKAPAKIWDPSLIYPVDNILPIYPTFTLPPYILSKKDKTA